jgi:hypothetical protein
MSVTKFVPLRQCNAVSMQTAPLFSAVQLVHCCIYRLWLTAGLEDNMMKYFKRGKWTPESLREKQQPSRRRKASNETELSNEIQRYIIKCHVERPQNMISASDFFASHRCTFTTKFLKQDNSPLKTSFRTYTDSVLSKSGWKMLTQTATTGMASHIICSKHITLRKYLQLQCRVRTPPREPSSSVRTVQSTVREHPKPMHKATVVAVFSVRTFTCNAATQFQINRRMNVIRGFLTTILQKWG